MPLATNLWYRTGGSGAIARFVPEAYRFQRTVGISRMVKGWGNPTPTTSMELRRLKSSHLRFI